MQSNEDLTSNAMGKISPKDILEGGQVLHEGVLYIHRGAKGKWRKTSWRLLRCTLISNDGILYLFCFKDGDQTPCEHFEILRFGQETIPSKESPELSKNEEYICLETRKSATFIRADKKSELNEWVAQIRQVLEARQGGFPPTRNQSVPITSAGRGATWQGGEPNPQRVASIGTQFRDVTIGNNEGDPQPDKPPALPAPNTYTSDRLGAKPDTLSPDKQSDYYQYQATGELFPEYTYIDARSSQYSSRILHQRESRKESSLEAKHVEKELRQPQDIRVPDRCQIYQDRYYDQIPDSIEDGAIQSEHPYNVTPYEFKKKIDGEKFEKDGVVVAIPKQDFASLNLRQLKMAEFGDGLFVQSCSVGNYHTMFPGDEILQINQQLIRGKNVSKNFALSVIETTADDMVTFRVRRTQHGVMVYVDLKGKGITYLGLTLNGVEVIDLEPQGLVATSGYLPRPKATGLGGTPVNWAMTEINGTHVPYGTSTDQVEKKLSNGGRELALLLQPIDFIQAINEETNKRDSELLAGTPWALH